MIQHISQSLTFNDESYIYMAFVTIYRIKKNISLKSLAFILFYSNHYATGSTPGRQGASVRASDMTTVTAAARI